jgi:hypothetical protein
MLHTRIHAYASVRCPAYFIYLFFFAQRWLQSTRYLAASLTSLENYMEVQRDKKITKRPCQKAKRTLELNAKCDQGQSALPPPDRCRPCGRTAAVPPGTHHLECRTVRSNTQSRRSGGAAALLPLSPAGWRIKPSKSHRRKAPKNEPDAGGAVTLRVLPPPRKPAPTEERGPRRHRQHHPLEEEEERTVRLLIPLATTAGREEKPSRTRRCSLPLPATTADQGREELPTPRRNPAPRPFIGVAGAAPAPSSGSSH